MRNGKIARLPREIREQLNVWLEKTEDSGPILEWLNGLPLVRQLLRESFDGVPISKQNLCEWRQGGFREWQLRYEWVDEASELRGLCDDLDEVIDVPLLAGYLATMVATRYAAVLSTWDGEVDPKIEAKLRVLRGLNRDIALLQRTLSLAKKEKDAYLKELEDLHEAALNKIKDKALAPIWAKCRAQHLAAVFGGGEEGLKTAQCVIAVEEDLPLPDFAGEVMKGKPASQAQSNPVQPEAEVETARQADQASPEPPASHSASCVLPSAIPHAAQCQTATENAPAGQTQSNPVQPEEVETARQADQASTAPCQGATENDQPSPQSFDATASSQTQSNLPAEPNENDPNQSSPMNP